MRRLPSGSACGRRAKVRPLIVPVVDHRLRTEISLLCVAAKIIELSSDLRELKKTTLALTHAKDEADTKFADLQDEVELSLLDKEVAEERLEASQAALAAEKERIAEMETELAVWREENQRMEALAAEGGLEGEDGDSGRSGLAFVQLEKQNLRLKDALVRWVCS